MKNLTINNELLEFHEIYYVSPNGDDRNSGVDKNNPLLTIQSAVDKCSSSEKCCVYLMGGTHNVGNMVASIYSNVGICDDGKPIHFLGECEKTIIYYDATKKVYRDGSAICLKNENSMLSNVHYKYNPPSSSDNYSKSIFNHSRGTVKNIYLENISSQACSYSYGNNNESPQIENCTFKTGTILTDYSGSPIYINCHYDNVPNKATSRITCVNKDILDVDLNIHTLSSELYHTGTGTNSDGSICHVGVCGGLYGWGNNIKAIIYQNGKYYKFDNDILVEIQDVSTFDINKNGCSAYEINNNLDLLDDEFEIVFKESNRKLEINGLKTKSELVVANNDFCTTIQENIDYFKCESLKTNNSSIKVVFSIDGGTTWKTHDGNDFVDLSINIPLKEYESLSTSELIDWDNSKNEILASGIESDILETIDFNILSFDMIRFAYVLYVDDIGDTCENQKLIWQFDSKGSMKKMKDVEYDLMVRSNNVEFKSLISNDMIKINILPDCITTNGDVEFATDSDIEDLFS